MIYAITINYVFNDNKLYSKIYKYNLLSNIKNVTMDSIFLSIYK